MAAKLAAGSVNFLASTRCLQACVGLQLQAGNVCSQRGDRGFFLQDLVIGSLEGSSDCTEALLLDPLQRLPDPLLLCWP